ncbi:MAG: orotidine-5'-phosphate decarboxylase [Actinomycetota bacterium]|nr:orotidine-5'-phosphate decarboxylase [Actinomycetota bacterium]MDK1016136.1 orotidine-5'-phosphate decarboxylase [Actinomycetota bacterium]MDK1095656.1 orotidine-5'-phosphate decarboxylase [Actinomycetota bacterium]MDK1102296.1 orotidine-5'-phosphate decarboxylase [Actinomycetota bacterium]
MVSENPIIVALDMPTAQDAVRMAQVVAPYVGAFKIGLGLLYGPGPGTIDALVRVGKPVFVDAKLHDIPSQVAAAAERIGKHGARWVTAHASGGGDMLEAAVEGLARGAAGSEAGVLGVSVLTSLAKSDLERVGIQRTPGQLVGKMAKVADEAGCEGLVCSPLELNVVAQAAPTLKRVTPGIRLTDLGDDQERTATPREAIARGATMLVIGRPITQAEDPAAAAAAILADITATGTSI